MIALTLEPSTKCLSPGVLTPPPPTHFVSNFSYCITSMLVWDCIWDNYLGNNEIVGILICLTNNKILYVPFSEYWFISSSFTLFSLRILWCNQHFWCPSWFTQRCWTNGLAAIYLIKSRKSCVKCWINTLTIFVPFASTYYCSYANVSFSSSHSFTDLTGVLLGFFIYGRCRAWQSSEPIQIHQISEHFK